MNVPRVMLAAGASGSGKTMITCGILQALVNRGMKVASFKCGPDYIDPMFHEKVIGTKSRNLDLFFTPPDVTGHLFSRAAEGSDISVIEGVMGFYDGIGGGSTDASSHDLSMKLDVPVVLVVNCKGSSTSAAAVVKGFKEFRKNNIKGVILNNMSDKTYSGIKGLIEREVGVKVIGHVPNVKDLVVESRHLGLVMPAEVKGLKDKLNGLADVLEKTLDLDSLVKMANSAPGLDFEGPDIERDIVDVRIGVASDEAFCFFYKDNLELLERMGAVIVPFSPLHDEHVPKDVSGIILPGGYPELYAEPLSRNATMLRDVRERIMKGMPCMAECGGFMYLHDELEDDSGTFRRMVGAIEGRSFRTGGLSRFGYVTVTSEKDGLFGKGTTVKGHEFHYWDSTDCGDGCRAVKTNGTGYACMHITDNMAAGFPHLYYYSNPKVVRGFLTRCASYSGDVEKRRT